MFEHNFNLDVYRCLQEAWKRTIIPDEIISFFSTLFNVNTMSILMNDEQGEYNDNIPVKIMPMIQSIYYNIHK